MNAPLTRLGFACVVLVGAGSGSLLGMLAAWGGAFFRFDGLDCTALSLAPMLAATCRAWGIGIGLSILGVLYPALLAAKLQPVIVMKEEY